MCVNLVRVGGCGQAVERAAKYSLQVDIVLLHVIEFCIEVRSRSGC